MNRKHATARSRGLLVAATLAGSWRALLPTLRLSADDLDEVTPLLYNSGGAALAWYRIRETELRATASAEVLHQGYRLQALQIAMRLEKIELVYQLLGEANIDAIMVKGWAVSNFYPERALRPLGDIDLLVKPKDYEVARAIFERPEARSFWVDLHKGLVELPDRSVDELFARAQTVKLRATEVRVLSTPDHLALLAIHLLKHGAFRPLWLCDIGAVVESLPTDFDWNTCLGANKRRATWIASSILLAHQLLEASIDNVPLTESARQIPQWLVDSVLKQWGNLFPGDHLPVQPRPLMIHSLGSPGEMLKAIRERWPDPIVATFNMRGRINNFPRLPYQLGAFAARAVGYLIDQLGPALQSRALRS